MSDQRQIRSADVVEQTRAWVVENFLYMRPDWPLNEETPLLRSGVVDSVGVIELVGYLERTFGCSIPEREITEENLGTLGAIGRFVSQGGAPASAQRIR